MTTNWAKNPAVLLCAIAAGIATGIFFKDFALAVEPVSEFYLTLVKMCVTPILVSSVVSSFARLFEADSLGLKAPSILVPFALAFLGVGAICIAVVSAMRPGALSLDEQALVGGLLRGADEGYFEAVNQEHWAGANFIRTFIPENIFAALASGKNMQILFFSMLIGIAAGLLKDKGKPVVQLSESLFSVCLAVLDWTMLFLPFGTFALMASQIAKTGPEIIIALARFVQSIYVSCVAVVLLGALIASWRARIRIDRVFSGLREPLFLAIGTRSTLASMPASIRALHDHFGVRHRLTDLVIPISSVMARFSMLILYLCGSVFAAQLYGKDIGLLQWTALIPLAAAVSFAGAGTPAVVSISLLSILFEQLRLPYSTMVVLLLAIIPLTDPLLTMTNVQTNCLLTILIDRKARTE